ncbi:unnamed protein product [Arabidopsis halleri]
MANRDYQSHVNCLFATMGFQGLSPLIPNQTPVMPLEPFVIWFISHFVEISVIHMIDSSHIHCRFHLIMLIRRNHDVFLYRKFVSGVLVHCRWNFWVLTGECPLTQWYGVSTWVFDPGINGRIYLLDGIRIRDRIGYYSCVECVNGFLMTLTLSGDGDVYSLPWLEYFISFIDYMGCGVYGPKIKVATYLEDDDVDYFSWTEAFLLPERVHCFIQLNCLCYKLKQDTSVMGRKMASSDCDSDVLSFPWLENFTSMKREIVTTYHRQRCARRFQYIILSFKRQEAESFQATIQFFLLIKIMRKAFWSFIYMMIANYEYVKGGRNRFYLLACKAFGRQARSIPLLYRNCVQFPLFVSIVVYSCIL